MKPSDIKLGGKYVCRNDSTVVRAKIVAPCADDARFAWVAEYRYVDGHMRRSAVRADGGFSAKGTHRLDLVAEYVEPQPVDKSDPVDWKARAEAAEQARDAAVARVRELEAGRVINQSPLEQLALQFVADATKQLIANAFAALESKGASGERGCRVSKTIVDFPKVTQMLDAGWTVTLFKNPLGTYTAHGAHEKHEVWTRARDKVLAQVIAANKCPEGMDEETCREVNEMDFDTEGEIDTDDFTPEQALTRLAYKVHGEIL